MENCYLSELEYAEILGKIVHSSNNYLAAAMGFNELSLLDAAGENYSQNALKSCQQGIDFNQSLLASIGRLQLKSQQHSLISLFDRIKSKAAADVNLKYLNVQEHDGITIRTDSDWFVKSFLELIEIIGFFSESRVEVKVESSNANNANKLHIEVISESFILTDEQRKNMFKPFYLLLNNQASRDIGLIKVKGFFRQINSEIVSIPAGFVITIPC